MAFAHHGGTTGSFTHAHHWEFDVAIFSADTHGFFSANAVEAGHAFGDREKILGTTVTATAKTVGVQEKWLLEWVPEHNQVAFRAHHSNFMSAGADGAVHANQAARTANERWVLTDAGDGFVGFQSSTGGFLHVDATGAVTAKGPTPSKLRVLLSVKTGDTAASIVNPVFQTLGVYPGSRHPIIPVAILTNGKAFLSSEADRVHGEAGPESESDVFFVDVQSGETVTLRTPHGKFVATSEDGGITLTSDVSVDAHWKLVQVVDGRAAFESPHKRFLTAEPSGRVIADHATPGIWEAFSLLPGPRPGTRPDHVHAAACIRFVLVTDHHLTGSE